MNTNMKPFAITNLFPGLRDAKTVTKTPYLRPGKYEVQVRRASYFPVLAGGHGFVLEFNILKSNYEDKLTEALKALTGQPYKLEELNKTLPNKVDTIASWYVAIKPGVQGQQLGWGNLKQFAADITSTDVDSPDFLAEVEMFISQIVQLGALNGAVLPVETFYTKTKAGGDFTRHVWGSMISGPTGVADPAQG